MFYTHEAPCWESVPVGVITAARCEDALDPIGAYDLDLNVTTTVMSNPHPHSNVLQCIKIVLDQVFLGYCDGACDAVRDESQSTTHFPIQRRRAISDLHSG